MMAILGEGQEYFGAVLHLHFHEMLVRHGGTVVVTEQQIGHESHT